jgi:type I restriction enzyme S subunit
MRFAHALSRFARPGGLNHITPKKIHRTITNGKAVADGRTEPRLKSMSFTANIDEIVAENHNRLLGLRPSWKRVRLKEVATILNGFPFESAKFKKDHGTPLLRIRDVVRGETETFYDGEYDPAFLVKPGDLVVGMDGDFNSARWRSEPALLNQRVCKLTVDPSRYSSRFLEYVLPGYLAAINAHTPSVTVKHLSSRTVADIPLPFPPLDEQERVVAEFEKQFTRLDAGVASLKRVHTGLKSYRASVLKAACEGRLFAIGSRNWKMTTIEDVCSTIYRYPTFYGIEHLSRGVPVIRGEHILFGGRISHDWSDYWFVSNEVSAKFPRTIVEAGDLVMSVRGSVGKIGIVDRELRGAQLSPNSIRLSPRRDVVDPRWLFIYLTSAAGAASVKEQVNQTTIETIKASAFKKTSIPLPTFAEQQEIIGEVERGLTVIDELRAVVETNLERTSRFRKSVLQQAFSGGGKFFSHALPESSKLGV